MSHITPQQFKDAFLQVVSARESDILDRWERPFDYTFFMQDTVFRELGKLLALNYYPEYYKIDGVYYSELDTEHFPKGSTFATNLSVALEHENEIRSSAIEMNKLQLFNTPLKVLITYTRGGPNDPESISQSERESYLELYANILAKGDIFGDFVTLRRQLIVFGRYQKVASNDHVKWRFYAYEESGFKELTPDPQH
jgi:hypothetical protein